VSNSFKSSQGQPKSSSQQLRDKFGHLISSPRGTHSANLSRIQEGQKWRWSAIKDYSWRPTNSDFEDQQNADFWVHKIQNTKSLFWL